jgi:hypothetical protein
MLMPLRAGAVDQPGPVGGKTRKILVAPGLLRINRRRRARVVGSTVKIAFFLRPPGRPTASCARPAPSPADNRRPPAAPPPSRSHRWVPRAGPRNVTASAGAPLINDGVWRRVPAGTPFWPASARRRCVPSRRSCSTTASPPAWKTTVSGPDQLGALAWVATTCSTRRWPGRAPPRPNRVHCAATPRPAVRAQRPPARPRAKYADGTPHADGWSPATPAGPAGSSATGRGCPTGWRSR